MITGEKSYPRFFPVVLVSPEGKVVVPLVDQVHLLLLPQHVHTLPPVRMVHTAAVPPPLVAVAIAVVVVVVMMMVDDNTVPTPTTATTRTAAAAQPSRGAGVGVPLAPAAAVRSAVSRMHPAVGTVERRLRVASLE